MSLIKEKKYNLTKNQQKTNQKLKKIRKILFLFNFLIETK